MAEELDQVHVSCFVGEAYTDLNDVDGGWFSRRTAERKGGRAVNSLDTEAHLYVHYDAEGRTVHQVRTADAEPDEVTDYTYDGDGNLLLYTIDIGGDGTFETAYTYTYTPEGEVLTVDYEVEGLPTARVEITYDVDGNRATWWLDEDDDGVGEQAVVYLSYDVEDNWIDFSMDYGDDGVIDSIFLRTFDGEGRPITMTERAVDDDTLMLSETWTWPDDFGSYEHTQDADGDGVLDSAEGVTYDGEERQTAWWEDDDGDGIRERESESEYHPDGYGIVRSVYAYLDYYGDPVTNTTTRTFGLEGRPLSERDDYVGVDFSYYYIDDFVWTCP